MILRPIAGLAAIVTAFLLQATLIGPLCVPLPVSLPAVVVAAVGLRAGPATGVGFGFSAGLLADLGSDHPAGVLALVWLGLGLVAGILGGLVTPVHFAAPVGRRRTNGTGNGTGIGRAGIGRADIHRAGVGRPGNRRPGPPGARTRSGGGHGSMPLTVPPRMVRRQAALVGALAGLAAPVAALLLTVTGTAADPLTFTAVRSAPAALLDAVLALAVVPAVGAVLDATGGGKTRGRPAPARRPSVARTTDAVRSW